MLCTALLRDEITIDASLLGDEKGVSMIVSHITQMLIYMIYWEISEFFHVLHRFDYRIFEQIFVQLKALFGSMKMLCQNLICNGFRQTKLKKKYNIDCVFVADICIYIFKNRTYAHSSISFANFKHKFYTQNNSQWVSSRAIVVNIGVNQKMKWRTKQKPKQKLLSILNWHNTNAVAKIQSIGDDVKKNVKKFFAHFSFEFGRIFNWIFTIYEMSNFLAKTIYTKMYRETTQYEISFGFCLS